jgi:hypothetical protein
MDNKIVDPIFKKKINRNTNILKIFNFNKNDNDNDNDSYNNYLNRDNKDNFFKMFKKKANLLIKKNHNSDELSIFKKISNDIVYNEKSHITAIFKDFLIYDDYSEFMKR